jgi:hypothetical protein
MTITGNAAIVTATGAAGSATQLNGSSSSLEVEGELTLIIASEGINGIVIGLDGQPYASYGDNTFSLLYPDGQIGQMICGGMDRNPGSEDDREDVSYLGSTKVLGPDANGQYRMAGPDKLLGAGDDAVTGAGGDETVYVNIGYNIFYPIDDNSKTGPLISGGDDLLPGTNDDSPWTAIGPDGYNHPVIAGNGGSFFADLGSNVYATIHPPVNELEYLLSAGIDLVPGTSDDRYNVVWYESGCYIGPNPDGTHYGIGPSGMLGTDDVIVNLDGTQAAS